MKSKNNFIIALLLGISLQLCGGPEQDLQRYNELIANFDQESKTFNSDFVLNKDEDSRIIEQAIAQNPLLQYKNSWTPTILKTLSYGFGINTFIDGLWAILKSVNAPYERHDLLYKRTRPIIQYPLKPISYTVDILNKPIEEGLFNVLLSDYFIYNYPSLRRIYPSTINLSAGAIGLAIALYLNAKANNYAEKTNELTNKMNIDADMLQALNPDINPLSSND
jgi:hypothetical protein